MKKIGLLGGMSWESTVTYYQKINEMIKNKLGGLHSAEIILYSVDFAEIEECQAKGDWTRTAEILSAAASALEKAGADFIVLCTNTMHKIVPQLEKNINIPVLHIAEATAIELLKRDIHKVALLGTKYTMQQDFYKEKLEKHGINVIIPENNDVDVVNQIIYEELCKGIISDESRRKYLSVIDKLALEHIGGVILGCTEIGLLLHQSDTKLPIFDTTLIHAAKAVEISLK
ncbi:aspartate/glutamate racemase family protein [Pectinatus sottacetonis]|uniref:aspartate/glutamate racemase family protein n=1 Tax=Pectinatus sottacetonis TaxID=1002795 RepID=UPI0018C5A1FA|nr:aspartate/glutamate racemase family protein [Pectinatus sottacetonis]